MPQLLDSFCKAKAYVELPAPDFAAHGVAVGLHLFPPSVLTRVQSSV